MSDDNAIAQELKRLTRDGLLLPSDVVEAARNPKSPLHPCFDWDDSEAAEKWRLAQARELIRVCVVVEPRAVSSVRAFVSLSSDRKRGGGYRPIAAVVASPDMYGQMLDDALNELKALQAKYTRLSELDRVFQVVEEVAKQRKLHLVA